MIRSRLGCALRMRKYLNSMNTSFQGKPAGNCLLQAQTETAIKIDEHEEDAVRLGIQHKAMDVAGIYQAVWR